MFLLSMRSVFFEKLLLCTLQPTYQHEALQMPEVLKHQVLNRPLNKGVMAWQKFPIYFLWSLSIILCSACTDKLQASATVHFLCKKTVCAT